MNVLTLSIVLLATVIHQHSCCSIPKAAGEEKLQKTLTIKGLKDYGYKRVQLSASCKGQSENQGAVFILEDGAHLKNVIIGANSGDGVHCKGSCTLENVHWEKVCEDAATMKSQDPKDVFKVIGGSATGANDKVFQHNGNGNLMSIKNFCANDIGKLARSCGTCKQTGRKFSIENVVVDNLEETIVGLQQNAGDVAVSLKNIQVKSAKKSAAICKLYQFIAVGDDPKFIKSGDGSDAACKYGGDVKIISRF